MLARRLDATQRERCLRLVSVLKRRDVDLDSYVLAIQSALLKEQQRSIDMHVDALAAALQNGDLNELKSVLAGLDDALGESMADRVIQSAGPKIDKLYTATQARIIQNRSWRLNKTDREALHWLKEDFSYWVGNHSGELFSKRLTLELEPALAQGLSRSRKAAMLQRALGGQIKRSRSYWEGLANHISTRAQTFGAIEGMVKAGATHYQVRAVRDQRTSPICQAMHGRIFTVQQAVGFRDKLMSAKTPESVKQVAPWRQPGEITGKPTKRLPQGMQLPPYHFNCRTTVVIWTEADPDSAVESWTQKTYSREALTKTDANALVDWCNGATWASPEVMKRHWEKHGSDRWGSFRQYTETSRLVSKGPRQVYLTVRNGALRAVFHASGEGGRPVVIVDVASRRIVSIHKRKQLRASRLNETEFVEQRRAKGIQKWLFS